MEILRVSSKSNPNLVAKAIQKTFRQDSILALQCVGPKAISEATKSVAIARGFYAPSGLELIMIPHFCDVEIDGEEKCGLRFIVEKIKRI